MVDLTIDKAHVASLREELAALPKARSKSRGRRFVLISGASAVALLAFGAGGAVAATYLLPGADKVAELSQPDATSGNTSTTVALPAPPAGTNSLEYTIQCFSKGVLSLPDGSEFHCAPGAPAKSSMPWSSDLRSFHIETKGAVSWKFSYVFSDRTLSPFALNAAGQTYGVDSDSRHPDLIAAIATNGEQGYIFRKALLAAMTCVSPHSPSAAVSCSPDSKLQSIPVYESDGTTQIGTYTLSK